MKLIDIEHTKILIRYSNKVGMSPPMNVDKPASKAMVGAVLRNMQDLGYTLSMDALDIIKSYGSISLEEFYKRIIKILKEITGASKKWKPMYPNFPRQVMEAEEAELYINAIIHYFGKYYLGTEILPEYEKEERFPLSEFTKLKVLEPATKDDFHCIFKNLISSPTSVSAEDMDNIKWYIGEYGNDARFPDKIIHKEILASVVKSCLVYGVDLAKLDSCAQTATDVLRIASAMSLGDVSLAQTTQFKKFKRKERKFLLSCLDSTNPNVEDMVSRREMWKRLGEVIHPGDHWKKYPKAFSAFQKLRNEKIITFNGQLESALSNKDIDKAVSLLEKRPGVFARRLNNILCKAGPSKRKDIVSSFEKVAEKVSTPVLLQVKAYFQYRDIDRPRIVFPKGSLAKARTLESSLQELPKSIENSITKICEKTLKNIYKDRNPLGKVFIDPELKNYIVPSSQRSASKALRTIPRGSRLSINTEQTLRMFIWWHGSAVDIDLSAGFYNEKWNRIDHVSYTKLRCNFACHSGDITSAPKGASEFIDVDLSKAKDNGIRYVAMCVYSYSSIPFVKLKECFAGWMEREEPQSGEIFEAKTVKNRIDLTSESKTAIPLLLDLQEGCVIWADMALSGKYSLHNIECSDDNLQILVQSIISMRKHNLYDLLKMNAESRGSIIRSKSKADLVCSVDEGLTPFDFDKISSDFI